LVYSDDFGASQNVCDNKWNQCIFKWVYSF
jgi:hypothetical protein